MTASRDKLIEQLKDLTHFLLMCKQLPVPGAAVLDQEKQGWCLAAAQFVEETIEREKDLRAKRSKAGSTTSKAKAKASQRNGKLGGLRGNSEQARINGAKAKRRVTTGAGIARNCKKCGKRHKRVSDPCGK